MDGSGSTAVITRTRPGDDPAVSTGSTPGAPIDSGEEEEEDDGRDADFLWIEVEGGASYVDLVALSNAGFDQIPDNPATPDIDESMDLQGQLVEYELSKLQGYGGFFGAALGFRVFFFALGARVTYASYGSFEVGTVGGEAQLRLPIPVVEPWVRLGAGYAWVGRSQISGIVNNSGGMPITANVGTQTRGFTLHGALGLDVFVTWWLSLGAGVSADFLNLSRQSTIEDVTTCGDPPAAMAFCPKQEGDAWGAQGRIFGQIGLHF